MEEVGQEADGASTHGFVASVGENGLGHGVQNPALDEDREEQRKVVDEQIRSSFRQRGQNVETLFGDVTALVHGNIIALSPTVSISVCRCF